MKNILRQIKLWLIQLDRRQRDSGVKIQHSDTPHSCPYCGEDYRGNYCPQCGLPPKVENINRRFTLANVLDIWNLGNLSVFRTMKHLLWRPGYMIDDWLNGCRGLYFPPVLTLGTICFLFGLVVAVRGVDLGGDDHVKFTINEGDSIIADQAKLDSMISVYAAKAHEHVLDSLADSIVVAQIDTQPDSIASTQLDTLAQDEQSREELVELITAKSMLSIENLFKSYRQWKQKNLAYALMLSSVLTILFMPLFFRRSPRREHTSVLEFFFIQVYICSMLMLLSTIWVLVTGDVSDYELSEYPIPGWISLPMTLLALYQLFGYNLWGTLWRYALVSFLEFFVLFLAVTTYVIYLFSTTAVSAL